MEEVWRLVQGFNGDYEISSHGRLRRSLTASTGQRGRLITHQQVCPKGKYLQYRMRLNGKKTARYIHRLVAEHFVPGFREGLQVNHIDGNKANNSADNLEWVTPQENIRHSCEIGLNPRYRGPLTGIRSGRLTVLYRLTGNRARVRCECGKEYNAQPSGIIHGLIKECRWCSNKAKAQLAAEARRKKARARRLVQLLKTNPF